MGKAKRALINERSQYRKWSASLGIPGVTGLLMLCYVVLQAMVSSIRLHRSPFETGNDFSPLGLNLIESGHPTPEAFGVAIICGLLLMGSSMFLTWGRNITTELRLTEADISRRRRVDEGLRDEED